MTSSVIEQHRNKISEKDTSENIMHAHDTGLLGDDFHRNEKHQRKRHSLVHHASKMF